MERRKLPKVVWPSLNELGEQPVSPKLKPMPIIMPDLAFEEMTVGQQAEAIIYEARRVMWQRPIGSGQFLLSGEAMSDGQLNRFNLSLGVITPPSYRQAFGRDNDELVRLSRNVSPLNANQYYGDPALIIEANDLSTDEPGGLELSKAVLADLTPNQRLALMTVVDAIMKETLAFGKDQTA